MAGDAAGATRSGNRQLAWERGGLWRLSAGADVLLALRAALPLPMIAEAMAADGHKHLAPLAAAQLVDHLLRSNFRVTRPAPKGGLHGQGW